jgi:hypothetical protein
MRKRATPPKIFNTAAHPRGAGGKFAPAGKHVPKLTYTKRSLPKPATTPSPRKPAR